MRFFSIEPEVSGAMAPGPPPGPATCVFDTWLGDEVVRAYPAVLVTTRVRKALLELRRPTGFDTTKARTQASDFFRKHTPGKRLPVFWAIEVHGQAGRDDMGLTAGTGLVVSGRVLDVLLDFRIRRAVLTQYAPETVLAGSRK